MAKKNKLLSANNVNKKESLITKIDNYSKLIITISISNQDLVEYMQSKKKAENKNLSLNNFITSRMSDIESKKKVLIADLSNLHIGKSRSKNLFDLVGANFEGSILYKTKFINCDLKGASFFNNHLEEVFFQGCNLSDTDFRESNLSSCEFSDDYCNIKQEYIQNIKFSSTASSMRVFSDIKNDKAKDNEHHRILHNKKLELEEIKKKTPLFSRLAVLLNLTERHYEYRKTLSEYNRMLKGIFYSHHMIHTSFKNIFKPEYFIFEPVILKEEREMRTIKKKVFFSFNRKKVTDFLSQKTIINSINDYAHELYIKNLPQGESLEEDTVVVADISSEVNIFGNNEWKRRNLSGLDFSGTDISEANFSGSDLSSCIFDKANISYSNFENSLLNETSFKNTKAIKTNFHNANLNDAVIFNSNFRATKFDWGSAKRAVFENVNLDFITANNVTWKQVNINNCTVNYAELVRSDFGNAIFSFVEAAHSEFSKSNFAKSQFENCLFNYSLFNLTKLLHTIWYKTNAEFLEARYANLTGAKLSEKCNFKNSDFSHSILDGIKAPRVDFTNIKMNYVKIAYGKFAYAHFNNAILHFAELDSCVFSEADCRNFDFVGGRAFNLSMVKSNFNKSNWNGAKLNDSNCMKANFSDANWKNFTITESILEGINNRRVSVNDSTEIKNCKFKDLNGQFYHYDEDNFMDIMFIEQLSTNIKNIRNVERLRRSGVFAFILKILNKEYRIPNKEIRRLCNYRMHNQKELKKYLKDIKLEDKTGTNIHKFRSINKYVQML